MAKKRDERHRYGQHYTPLEVARLLAAFAVRSETDLVFDPSCGDGRLLKQAHERLKALSGNPDSGTGKLAHNLFGVERSGRAAALAGSTGARIIRADFFDLEPGARSNASARSNGGVPLPFKFDAIIGNPPYIRQELMGARDKQRIEKRLERGRRLSPEIAWPGWSGRSDIYVYFFAHATRFLKPGGRLVFLTASSWLDAGYGSPLREFLLENYKIISIIESSSESFFADASINTIITVLDREADPAARAANIARFVQLSRPLGEIGPESVIEFTRDIDRSRSSVALDTHSIRVIKQCDLYGTNLTRSISQEASGWGKYLRAEDIFFEVIERAGAKLKELSSLARVRFGVKTGANEFFYVKEAAARLMPLADMAEVRRGITTGANDFFYVRAIKERKANGKSCESLVVEDSSGARHRIEARFLSPIVFTLKEISGIVLEKPLTAKLFFNCSGSAEEIAGTGASRYVAEGERAGYHLRPTCAARNPWYGAARGLRPAPLIFPSKVGERWVVALNRDGVFEDKKLYGIFPRRGASIYVLAALLNSTWARYCAEVTCRQMTGAQAIADIDVAVAERILLPDPHEMSTEIKKELERALRTLSRRPVFSVFEEINRADRRKLDELVLAAIGITDSAEREEMLDRLYEAITRLVRTRITKSVASKT